FSPIIMYVSVMLGLFFNMTNMLWVALFFFGVTVIFALLTLPVERNASKRAMSLLHEADLLKSPDEEDGARSVLRAAAMTYLAAFVTSVLQFFYYLRAVERESDEDAMREARRDAVKQSTQASARAPQRRR
ncbi:MAG: zinc metallopeptidase, partial [Anaerolineae bacterium]